MRFDRPFAVFLGLLLVLPATASAIGSESEERARIQAEKASAESRFRAKERDCLRRFAVTACTDAARAQRREALQRLRGEELVLDRAQRKRQAAERAAQIRDKRVRDDERPQGSVPPADVAASAIPVPLPAPDAGAGSASQAGEDPPDRPGHTVRLRKPVRAKPAHAPPRRDAAGEARNRAAFEAKQLQAQERREAAQKRREAQEDKKKPPAAPLPVPADPPAR